MYVCVSVWLLVWVLVEADVVGGRFDLLPFFCGSAGCVIDRLGVSLRWANNNKGSRLLVEVELEAVSTHKTKDTHYHQVKSSQVNIQYPNLT
jgi:hypothetical protein